MADSSGCLRTAEPYDQFPCVLSIVEPLDRAGCLLDTPENLLAIVNSPLFDPLR
jgi:hypothetical protein